DLNGLSSFFPSMRSMTTVTATITGTNATALFQSSDASWGETDFTSVMSQTAQYNAATDTQGPLDLAYAVEGSGSKPTRLIVIGNSTFVANGPLNARLTVGGQQAQVQSGNGQLLINSIHWLANQADLIALPPKAAASSQMFLTGQQSLLLQVSTILLLPGAILLLGTLVWLRRR
ncbi:MAG TPA: hypothetical protein VF429_04595, partial [Anaerolineae bacterium]